MKTRAAALLAMLTMVVVLSPELWAGGSRAAQPAQGQGIDRSNFNALGSYPLVKQKETINVIRGLATDFNGETNLMTKFYEDKTNVHVNWIPVPIEQFKERVNMALASGENVDVVVAANNALTAYNMNEYLKFADQKIILPLQDLIASDTVNLKQRLDAEVGWRDVLTLPNGGIYALPTLNDCYHCRYYGKMWVNTEFLKNLNLTVPTTTEEFRQMLLAFKNRDANGNGDPNDEIPMMAATGHYGHKIDTYLMSAFVYDDGMDRLYVDNGKVTAAYTQNEFREGLRYLNSLYNDGLITKDSFTSTNSVRIQRNSAKYESVIGAMPALVHNDMGSREAGQPVRWIDYRPIPPLTGPRGLRVTKYEHYQKYMTNEAAGFIPASSRNPALVMRWLDWFYTEEGTTMLRYGEKGVGWTDPAPGATGPDGSPAKIRQIRIEPSHPNYGNITWGAAFPNYTTFQYRNTWETAADMLAPDGSGAERFLYTMSSENYAPYAQAVEKLLPPLYYNAENAFEMTTIVTNINTFVEESIAKFVVGDLDLNAGWDRFQAELKNLGIDRYLQIVQSTYDSSPFAAK